jgi:hypothetical protein
MVAAETSRKPRPMAESSAPSVSKAENSARSSLGKLVWRELVERCPPSGLSETRFLWACDLLGTELMTRAIETLCKHLDTGNIDAALTLIRVQDVLRGPILVRGFPIWQHCMMAAPSRIADFLAAGLHPDVGALSQGQTWLQYAASVNRTDWIQLLLQYGANVDQPNMVGETALGYAVTYGNMEAVRSLVDAGANVNYVEGSPEGIPGTILDNAQEARLIDYLRRKGAKYLSDMG